MCATSPHLPTCSCVPIFSWGCWCISLASLFYLCDDAFSHHIFLLRLCIDVSSRYTFTALAMFEAKPPMTSLTLDYGDGLSSPPWSGILKIIYHGWPPSALFLRPETRSIPLRKILLKKHTRHNSSWWKNNRLVKAWLWNSMKPHITSQFMFYLTTNEICQRHILFSHKKSALRVYNTYDRFFTIRQEGQMLEDYFGSI